MLTYTTAEAVKILGYAPWDEGNERMGEFVRYQVPGEDRTRRDTLDRAINGSRPEPESVVCLTFEERLQAKAVNGAGGEAQLRHVPKRRVVGFTAPLGTAA